MSFCLQYLLIDLTNTLAFSVGIPKLLTNNLTASAFDFALKTNSIAFCWPSTRIDKPKFISSTWPIFIREGTPNGFKQISIGVPSSINGMSATGATIEIHPLFPWRPDILSPIWILRFWIMNTLIHSITSSSSSSLLATLNLWTLATIPSPPCGTFNELSRYPLVFPPKITCNNFSSGEKSLCPRGVCLPTKMSPSWTSAPTMMIPSSSK